MNTFDLTIISPKGKVFDAEITSLIAPGIEGQFGVLARHSHMVNQLGPGVLVIRSANGDQYFTVDSGILEVSQNGQVLILVDSALPAGSEDAAKQQLADLARK